MARENRFVILMTESERQTVEALAAAEKIPASTLVRSRILLEAEKRGFVPANANRAGVRQDFSSAIASN